MAPSCKLELARFSACWESKMKQSVAIIGEGGCLHMKTLEGFIFYYLKHFMDSFLIPKPFFFFTNNPSQDTRKNCPLASSYSILSNRCNAKMEQNLYLREGNYCFRLWWYNLLINGQKLKLELKEQGFVVVNTTQRRPDQLQCCQYLMIERVRRDLPTSPSHAEMKMELNHYVLDEIINF